MTAGDFSLGGMEFAKIIKELRIQKGYTQMDLARLLSVDQTSVKNWEKGHNETDFKTLVLLARIFDVSTDYLLGLEDDFGNKITDDRTPTNSIDRSI